MKKILFLFCLFTLITTLDGCFVEDISKNINDFFEESSSDSSIYSGELPMIIIQSPDDKNDEGLSDTDETDKDVTEYIYDVDNRVYSKEAYNEDEISLAFIGDICFHDDFSNMSTLRSSENGIYDCIKPEVLGALKCVDIFMANNEFPYSNRGTPLADKQYTFRSKPENVNILDDMGVDIVSLANNHAYDWGPDALVDSFDILNEAKVPFVGAGKNIDDAMKPVYFKINNRTIAYTSATQIERLGNPDTKEATEDSPGVLRTLNPGKFIKVISEAKANSDFVVVYVHWGSESTDLVEQSQKDLALQYVEAGADLIIGDHSHCLQGLDYVKGVPVIYSLGNFWFNSKRVDTGYLTAILDRDCNIKQLRFVPCVQEGCRTRLASDSDRQRILNYLQGISFFANIDDFGVVTEATENHNVQNGKNTLSSD